MIAIPVEAHLVTLQVKSLKVVAKQIQAGSQTQTRHLREEETREVPPQRDEASVKRAVQAANATWAQAGIRFDLQSTDKKTTSAPGGRDVLTDADYFALVREFPAKRAVSLIFVSKLQSSDGGLSNEAQRAALLPALNDKLSGQFLAHEFGHLLGLGHVENQSWNVMAPGLGERNKLNPSQVQKSHASNLVKLFGRKM